MMIAYIQGQLIKKTPTWIVVETQGLGWHIHIPISTYEAIGEVGEELKIFTHLHVREDGVQLFGFATEREKELFLLLISVSGIGPKLAQGILSGISVEDFERAIQNQEIEALFRVPGIGKKTAERLILELRGKISRPVEGIARVSLQEESVLALMSLGYKRAQAQAVVEKVLRQDSGLTVEEVLRRALQEI